ncbi:MAG: STAS domain-containing protein [Nitrospiraceae bacterium]
MERGTQHTLTVTTNEKDGIAFVKMKGSLASTTAAQAEEELKKIVDRGATKVVVNLAELDYIASAGLRVFLLVSQALAKVNGSLMISESKGVVWDVIETGIGYGFAPLIRLFNTDQEAVAAFKSK